MPFSGLLVMRAIEKVFPLSSLTETAVVFLILLHCHLCLRLVLLDIIFQVWSSVQVSGMVLAGVQVLDWRAS
jgi:hypothetical protein